MADEFTVRGEIDHFGIWKAVAEEQFEKNGKKTCWFSCKKWANEKRRKNKRR